MTLSRLRPSSMAAGGDAVARDEDGRVVFVRGALPGEVVEVDVVDTRRDYARAVVRSVVEASPARVAPPCPQIAAGCGGCGWQHVDADAQRAMKVSIVLDALARIGRLRELPVDPTTVELPAWAYRTTAHAAVSDDGTVGFHEARGHRVVAATGCLVAHPLLAALLDGVRLDAAARGGTFRVSAATGERAALLEGRSGNSALPPDVVLGGSVHEDVAGRRLVVSIRSFFQAGPAIADALVDAVDEALGDSLEAGGLLVDLYAGVGLFGAVIAARRGARVEAVEVGRSAVADARVNLAGLDAVVVSGEVGDWAGPQQPGSGDGVVVVADPARSGLGRPGVAAVDRSGADRLVLVSCDAASLGRDARLLGEAGFRLRDLTLVDAFPQTPHVEVVTRFDRFRAR